MSYATPWMQVIISIAIPGLQQEQCADNIDLDVKFCLGNKKWHE